MENFLSDVDKRNLVQELSHGRELAKQLHIHLLQSSSPEAGKVLLNQISNSFEQALSLINHGGVGGSCEPVTGGGVLDMLVADPPPQSLTGSPPTDDVSDHESKDQANRKSRRWTTKMEVCGATGIERHLDDGYGWRKYGQKDILGAKFPRGYYRCTHRYRQGCLATKQIQRSDYDPNILDITYCGIHTCDPAGNPSLNDPPIPITSTQTQLETLSLHQNNHQFLPQPQQHFFDVQTSLKIISQDSHTLTSLLHQIFSPEVLPPAIMDK
ncbi:LOW QUALITY PROTEIN: putative WRKY transcription factor 30 [Primulina tabacum]|uniref:LOW QUALITY PROTEIN: putative WRKY transcription factor 30 n=1 Tax=Primulina tabacum TaxID=48773 RepID=UPI003F59EAE3